MTLPCGGLAVAFSEWVFEGPASVKLFGHYSLSNCSGQWKTRKIPRMVYFSQSPVFTILSVDLVEVVTPRTSHRVAAAPRVISADLSGTASLREPESGEDRDHRTRIFHEKPSSFPR